MPKLSVIICVYDMAREAPRTILSATVPQQRGVEAADYEVIVVDNGSPVPLADQFDVPQGVRLVRMTDPSPSPVRAMNWAARELAHGEFLLFAIDGARIFSDGMYCAHLAAHRLVDDAFVYTLGWHLGSKVQHESTLEGYDQAVEDALIASSGWPGRQDALFDVAVFSGASRPGFFRAISESNAFSVSRRLFETIGGYDERFEQPGGGLCNLEIFRRYVTRPEARNVCLLSEGSFHQVHGGVATSGAPGFRQPFADEYERIFGEEYRLPPYKRLYFGDIRPAVQRFINESLARTADRS